MLPSLCSSNIPKSYMPMINRPSQQAPPSISTRKPVRGSLVWWLRILGIVAFVLLLLRLPKSQDVQLVHIDLRWLGFCMLLTILQLLLEAFVWQWLLSSQRIRYPYPKTILTYLASQYLGLVTPGHVGEFLAAGYISADTGITFGYALSSVVVKKVLNWMVIMAFGIWGLPLLQYVPFFQGVRAIMWFGLGVLVVFLVGISVWVLSLRRLTRKWEKLSPWQIDMTEFWGGVRHLIPGHMVIPLLVTVTAYSLLFFELNAVLRSLGIVLSIGLVAKMVALSRFAARLIPISVVGFGTKDAAIIWLLAQHGVTISAAVTVVALTLVCSYLITLLLSGLCWWIKPLVVRRAHGL